MADANPKVVVREPQFTPTGMEVRPGQQMRMEKSVEVTVTDPEGWDLGGIHYDKGDKVLLSAKHHENAKKLYPGKFEGADHVGDAATGKKIAAQIVAQTDGTKVVRNGAGAFSPSLMGAKVTGGTVQGVAVTVTVDSFESPNQITVSKPLDSGTPTLTFETGHDNVVNPKKAAVSVQANTNGTKGVHSNAGAFTADMMGAKVKGGKSAGADVVVTVESYESQNQITVSGALDTGTPILTIEKL